MKQLHIVCDISIRSGGLGLAALRYAQSIAKAGAHVTLWVAKRASDELEVQPAVPNFNIVSPNVQLGTGRLVSFWEQVKSVAKHLEHERFDMVHVHGIWSPILAIAAYIANARAIPYAVSPHGCLEPWALAHRGFKKQIALTVYQRRVLKRAAMLVATANQELESIKAIGITGLVTVIPNGVDRVIAPKKWLNEQRKILFLSRIHPIKGLADLVQAWARVRQTGWRIVIAGPSELGHAEEIKVLTQSLGVSNDFDFVGLVSGDEKERCFANADIFVLPTYSENFGIAVAEALARGLPVITTTGAPWEDLEVYQCGWWVRPGVDGIAAALTTAMTLTRDKLLEMGARGQKLIEEKYLWDQIGRDALRASIQIMEKHKPALNKI